LPALHDMRIGVIQEGTFQTYPSESTPIRCIGQATSRSASATANSRHPVRSPRIGIRREGMREPRH